MNPYATPTWAPGQDQAPLIPGWVWLVLAVAFGAIVGLVIALKEAQDENLRINADRVIIMRELHRTFMEQGPP
jgi:hypothetical protein